MSVLSLAACAPPTPLKPDLPESISPGWTLASLKSADVNQAPAAVRAARPQAAWLATYTGPATAHARIWALPQPATGTGLDLVQRWTPEPNTIVFYSDRYFTAVDYGPVEREKAGALVRALEKALGRQRD